MDSSERETGRSLVHVAGTALGAVAACGVAAAIAALVEAIREMLHGGLGSLAVFALPYIVVFTGLAATLGVIASRVWRGQWLRIGAGAGVVAASVGLVVTLNGQWFDKPLEFAAKRCGPEACLVLATAPSPHSINPKAMPVAVWGGIAFAAIVLRALEARTKRRAVLGAALIACGAITLAGVLGYTNGERATRQARSACAIALAAEAGEARWASKVGFTDPPARFVDACLDPVAVARSRPPR